MRHGAVSEPYCGLDNLCRNDAPDFRSFYFRSRILQPPTVIRLHSVTARRLPRLRSFIYLIVFTVLLPRYIRPRADFKRT